MAVFKKSFNIYTIQSDNLKNIASEFFEMLITKMRPYFCNS